MIMSLQRSLCDMCPLLIPLALLTVPMFIMMFAEWIFMFDTEDECSMTTLDTIGTETIRLEIMFIFGDQRGCSLRKSMGRSSTLLSQRTHKAHKAHKTHKTHMENDAYGHAHNHPHVNIQAHMICDPLCTTHSPECVQH